MESLATSVISPTYLLTSPVCHASPLCLPLLLDVCITAFLFCWCVVKQAEKLAALFSLNPKTPKTLSHHLLELHHEQNASRSFTQPYLVTSRMWCRCVCSVDMLSRYMLDDKLCILSELLQHPFECKFPNFRTFFLTSQNKLAAVSKSSVFLLAGLKKWNSKCGWLS